MVSSFKNKRVLITGASGFIGSHMVRRMVKEGAKVFILARQDSDLWRISYLKDSVEVYTCDIRNALQVDICINKIKPDYVFHMAAYGVDSRQKDYLVAAYTNIIGTVNLLNSLKAVGCTKFLNAGTCMEYGDKDKPIKEYEPLEPLNIYGSTKASAGILAHQIAAENNIDIVTLRAFGIFGEAEGSHKFFPHIILSILNGKDVELTSCEQYRDYCYIDNIIDGFVLAALNNEAKNEIFNIGSGNISPLKDYVNLIFSHMGAKTEPAFGVVPHRSRDVWRPQPDITKIQTKLKWEPKVSLEDGLAITINWFKQNKAKYEDAGR
ncbi:SDR family NAD(P)-dependent oxidoreductase [Proteinivorax hydrogeniformans]|uniref:SDR family NAD(P)-dependent oxidoreductase n=1 Tax=Proteinivorax hydrogeniformans TaxID=1826727 RepID=A0AAU8HV44_9FIRM